MKLLRDIFKGIFTRRKQQATKHPEQQPERKKPPGRWIITVNRIQREQSKKVKRWRKTNKMGRTSRQINRRKAA